MVLIGEYAGKVTSGNRIAIPKQFAKELGNELIATTGFEQHLVLVNHAQFEKITQGVVDLPFIQGDVRQVSRYLLGNAFPVKPDAQGRFVIPEKLLYHAGIQNTVVFLGLGSWVEIWDEVVWQKHSVLLSKHSAELANRLIRLQREEAT